MFSYFTLLNPMKWTMVTLPSFGLISIDLCSCCRIFWDCLVHVQYQSPSSHCCFICIFSYCPRFRICIWSSYGICINILRYLHKRPFVEPPNFHFCLSNSFPFRFHCGLCFFFNALSTADKSAYSIRLRQKCTSIWELEELFVVLRKVEKYLPLGILYGSCAFLRLSFLCFSLLLTN